MKSEIIFENDFQQVVVYNELGIYEERFKAISAELFGDSYIREVTLFVDMVIAANEDGKSIQKLIISTIEGGPTMEPRVQDYMHEELYPRLAQSGVTAKAYCLGEEIISKLSVELTADSDPNKLFDYKFFATIEEGIDWLKSK